MDAPRTRPLRLALAVSVIACLAFAIFGVIVAGIDLAHDDDDWDGLGVFFGGLFMIIALPLAAGFGALAWVAPRAPRPVGIVTLAIGGIVTLVVLQHLVAAEDPVLWVCLGVLGLTQACAATMTLTGPWSRRP